MAQRRSAGKAGKESPGGAGLHQEVRGLLIAAVGAWFLLSLAGKGGGALGEVLSLGLRALAGEAGAWVISALLVWFGLYLVYLRYHRRPFQWGRQGWGLVLLLLAFELILQLATQGHVPGGGDLENARRGLGGGLIGLGLAVPLTRAFGEAGRWVFVATAALIGLVLGTGLSLGAVLEWLKARFVAGARGAREMAGDFAALVKPQPGEAEALAEERSPRRRQAATEELNTIGDPQRQPGTDPGEGRSTPLIRQPGMGAASGMLAEELAAVVDGGLAGAGGAFADADGALADADGALAGAGGGAGGGPGAAPGDVDLVPGALGTIKGAAGAPGGVPGVAAGPAGKASGSSGAGSGGPGAGGAGSRTPAGHAASGRWASAAGSGAVPLVAGDKGHPYQLPPLSLLSKPQHKGQQSHEDHLAQAQLLESTLASFGVEARVVEISPGPSVTRYELQPGPGVRVNKFTALTDDIALALAAEEVRIEAPIPGKSAVGIEVPNKVRLPVHLREVMETPAWLNAPSKLSVAFGKDQAGNPVVGDLAKMPHLLIAGSTGSGKSVCMNTIICSLLFKARPDEVKMMMIDPKMVELSIYNGIPHLMAPVITDPKQAAGYLKGAVKEMESRYELFAALGVRNITQYNQLVRDDPGPDPDHPRQPLPYVVIFVDELADLMMVAPVDVEDAICRLAQMARACGMHLVIATQSPRVDVITGLIKANIPSRIAFAVSSQVDSRVILDYAGAERLLGKGDMLYHPAGHSKAIRVQGAFIHEREIDQIVKFVKAQGQPTYTAREVEVEVASRRGHGSAERESTSALDEAFPEACRVVVEHGQASVSLLQRRLRCNYTKAARLIDMMEERGFIGPHQGSKPREVYLTMPQWQELFGSAGGREEVASTGEE